MLKIDITSGTKRTVRIAVKLTSQLCTIVMLLLTLSCASPPHDVLFNAVAEVYFSPKGGCTEAIVSEISRAKSEILVQAYSFTSNEIAEALADAHTRGVSIQIILDRSQRTARRSVAIYTSETGIPTFIDSSHAIAHNKVMIIDKLTVITGSFNFTKAAEESNAENLLIVRSSALARLYSESWNDHRKHSEKYFGQEAKLSQRN